MCGKLKGVELNESIEEQQCVGNYEMNYCIINLLYMSYMKEEKIDLEIGTFDAMKLFSQSNGPES